jgi:16S rRNA (uracil1498-N3)-methyltransferase
VDAPLSDNRFVLRRLHVPDLSGARASDRIAVSDAQARHARDVLRLPPGTTVELFDDAGRCAGGVIVEAEPGGGLRVEVVSPPRARVGASLTIGAAIPKGDRADWMVEKLSELGVARWIPLLTARAVVSPRADSNKSARWRRIAVESAKQSRRTGVMCIDDPTDLSALLQSQDRGQLVVLSPEAAAPLVGTVATANATLLIGPEGGWTETELSQMQAGGAMTARLTGETILRTETAAIVAAAVWLCAGNADR